MTYSYAMKVSVSAVVLVSFLQVSQSQDGLHPTCASNIYCQGPLLHTIQMAKIYPDSKTFVDMKLKFTPNETMQKFELFMLDFPDRKPSQTDVKAFVEKHFEDAGYELDEYIPTDWVEHPTYLDLIKDEELRWFGKRLNRIWHTLGRKMKDEIRDHQQYYSIVWVPNPVIVPGGRFREFYYWDSYWIVQGLLLSEMHQTVKGMLENFLYIVNIYGSIPNGGRIYYLARSQPPLLVPMIKLYYEHTHDTNFIKDNMHTMEKEFEYWMKNHTKVINFDGKNYTLALYGDKSFGPRPESYSEDVESAKIFKEDSQKESFYSEIKAAAESGWDFSSRWFITNGTNKGNLTNIKTRSLVPVDLNAMIYWNAEILSEFQSLLGNTEKSKYYKELAQDWITATTAVLWHEEIGAWLDYDISNSVKRDYFYPSNIAPLWTGCYPIGEKDRMVRGVLKYLENKNIQFPGGIPASMQHTGEQWDYPNAWPPLQHMMIVGLNNTGDEYAARLAFELAQSWIRSNYKNFKETDAMFEKYDATVFGGSGTGGEYEVQLGFGWSNGVIMDLLYRYSDQLRVNDLPQMTSAAAILDTRIASSSISSITTALIALLVSLSAGFIGICIYKRRSQYISILDRKRPAGAKYTELRDLHGKNASHWTRNVEMLVASKSKGRK